MIPIISSFDTYFDMKRLTKRDIELQKMADFGEQLEGGIEELGLQNNMEVEAITIIKKQQGKMPPSVFLLQAFAGKMALRKDYSNITFRVLMHFIALSEYENFISIDIKSISENLGISQPSAKRATKQLTEDNIIIKNPHPSDKRRIDYFLNPMAAWKGKTLKRDKQIDKYKKDKIQLDMFGE